MAAGSKDKKSAAAATLGKPKGGGPTLGRPTAGNFTFSPGRTANIGTPMSQGTTRAAGGGYTHRGMGVKFSGKPKKGAPKATKRFNAGGVK